MSGKIPIPLPKLSAEFETELAKLRSLLENKDSMHARLDQNVEDADKILSSEEFISLPTGSLLQMAETLRTIIDQQGASYKEYSSLTTKFIGSVFANDQLLKHDKEIGKLAMSLKDLSNKSSLDKLQDVLENICNLLVKFEWYCRLVQINDLTELDANIRKEVNKIQERLLIEAKSSRKKGVRKNTECKPEHQQHTSQEKHYGSSDDAVPGTSRAQAMPDVLEKLGKKLNESDTSQDTPQETKTTRQPKTERSVTSMSNDLCDEINGSRSNERKETAKTSLDSPQKEGSPNRANTGLKMASDRRMEMYDGPDIEVSKASNKYETSGITRHGTEISQELKERDFYRKAQISNTVSAGNDYITNRHNIKTFHVPEIVIDECEAKKVKSLLGELAKRVINNQPDFRIDRLEILASDVEKEHLTEFLCRIQLNSCLIEELSISYNARGIGELMIPCCKIVNKCDIRNLSLQYNGLRDSDIHLLNTWLAKEKQLDEININHNKNISSDGYFTIGKILMEHHVKIFRAADCCISDDQLEQLISGMTKERDLKDTKLQELDISFSNSVTSKGFGHLAELVRNKAINKLKLSGFQLTAEKLEAFIENLKLGIAIEAPSTCEELLEELEVSYNPSMEPEAYKTLGLLVKVCGVKRLSLAGCGLRENHLKNLREQTKEHKMTYLDAADNSSIGKGIIEIAKIVRESNLNELDISQCFLSEGDLKNFRVALGDKKLEYLNLSDFEKYPSKRYVLEVCRLLPSITKKLDLEWDMVDRSSRILLQNALDDTKSNLKIVLNEDQEDILYCSRKGSASCE